MAEYQIPAEQWASETAAARRAGFRLLVNLTAVDELGRSDEIRVILTLENPETRDRADLVTRTSRGDARLPDIAHVFPGAAWLQRQVHDFFGVHFDGGDNRPLIHHAGGAPLRKGVLLEPRQAKPWPGAVEPGSSEPGRRKLLPPGVEGAK
ncbi:MAG: NADH-quinone oxidoreductase subunit C [Propionibacteriaceae bacterium]|nr:NADH-quinone oxidoreductase subunit C [Propionibacteriaceae bacterium]